MEASALASGLTVPADGGDITGTLLWYDGSGWQEGTWDEDEKEGNFLPLKLTSGSPVQVEISEGKHPGKVTSNDGFCIFRVQNTSQTITITAGDNTKTYTLTKLTLKQKASPVRTRKKLT